MIGKIRRMELMQFIAIDSDFPSLIITSCKDDPHDFEGIPYKVVGSPEQDVKRLYP